MKIKLLENADITNMIKLSDITDKERLKRILDKNFKLYNDLKNECEINKFNYVMDDILGCFDSHYINYKFIDHYGQTLLGHFWCNSSNGAGGFLDGVEQLADDYGFFSNDVLKLIDKAIDIYENYDYEDDEYDELWDYIDIISEDIEKGINEILVVSSEEVYNYFINSSFMFDYLYVDNNDIVYNQSGEKLED